MKYSSRKFFYPFVLVAGPVFLVEHPMVCLHWQGGRFRPCERGSYEKVRAGMHERKRRQIPGWPDRGEKTNALIPRRMGFFNVIKNYLRAGGY